MPANALLRRLRRRSGLRVKTSASPPRPLMPPPGRRTPARVDHPDVSFVIPVYNAEPWLDDCVSSALAQTRVNVEVICVNDGSTDRSLENLRRLAAADPRVTIID